VKGWGGRRPPKAGRYGAEAGEKGGRRARILFWAELLGAAAAIVVVLVPVVRFLSSKANDAWGGDGNGWIVVSEANVTNGPQLATMVGTRYLQSAESTPAIDVTVRNTGDEPVLMTEARVTIEDSARLPSCLYGGGGQVPASPPYVVFLPLLPRPEEEVRRRRLHEEVPAKGLDRLLLQFGIPADSQNDHLYALHLELLADRPSQTIDVGRFLLGVPQSPSRTGAILPEDNRTLETLSMPYQHRFRRMSVWCMRRNLAELQRLLRVPGKRAPEVAALSRLRLASKWRSFAGKWGAEESIEPLLHQTNIGEGPVLAAYAASTTGDRELYHATRVRAAELEIEQSRKQAYYLPGAALLARQALELDPSPSIRAAWERIEARLRVEEREEEKAA
jgi:hypothetical protein